MKKPTVHLICNAHLDPVWQWRWEEGCAETLSTFGNAVDILDEYPDFIFNHNEAILYQWIQRYDPALFRSIQKLVRAGKWCISGGWFLQPDVNIPGTESLIRQIAVGRAFFQKHFSVKPRVAYNFDSFGHSGGLPQILRQSGYEMYVHMRPQHPDLKLPSDLYRWRGVDGSEILACRIAIGFYHSEYDNMAQRLAEGTELALKLKRDVPLFWGLGNHGGGATREVLEEISGLMKQESRVHIIHSTTEKLYDALKKHAGSAPLVVGDLQRVFTGCYTSLARVKRRAVKSLAEIVQAEALCTLSWRHKGSPYPAEELKEIWRDHLFNDFHDILPGSSTEPAEHDALDQYGKASESLRRLRLSAITKFTNEGRKRRLYVPVTVWNTNTALYEVPLEVECVVDYRPKWVGEWHLELSRLGGETIICQEEQPESLLPFAWRRKLVFMADLPRVGSERFEIRCVEGTTSRQSVPPLLDFAVNPEDGLISSLRVEETQCLAGTLLQPLVVEDDGDSWGADRWSYRNVVGKFSPLPEEHMIVEEGPIRTIRQSAFTWNRSSMALRTISYASWPVIEFQFRIHWAETKKRLKLSVPTVFRTDSILCEIPGGAIARPSDGEEYPQGRWCLLEGGTERRKVGFGIVNSGQHGFDFKDGEVRLSVLRSAAYCHDKGLVLDDPPARKYMDQGVHEVRMLICAGPMEQVRQSLTGLADWLAAPPVVLAHLPVGTNVEQRSEFLTLQPRNVRLLALKRSDDGKALIVRLQEVAGVRTKARLSFTGTRNSFSEVFRPFEIKTLRVEGPRRIREVKVIEEQ